MWQDVGANLFPYQRNSSVNIDYGCLNPATIAYLDTVVVWLAANEKSGPMIAYTTGGDIRKISTDGIDFQLTKLKNPSNAYGFLFRQDGHLLYQITFPDDNLTYVYDFNTQMFFTLCDENMNAHIAKRVAFFNDKYYFVSFIDGDIYEMGTQFTTYNGVEIPRIRVCKNIRLPDASRFAINNLTFTLEQGTQTLVNETLLQQFTEPLMTESGETILTESGEVIYVVYYKNVLTQIPQTVALTVSKNGGESFGTIWSKDFIAQFRFHGLSRFVVTDGIVGIYQ